MPDPLEAIKARLDAATPGPWSVETESEYYEYSGRGATYVVGVCRPNGRPVFRYDDDYGTDQLADATFIAHAPADIAYLLAEVGRLTELAEQRTGPVVALHAYVPSGWRSTGCAVCGRSATEHRVQSDA